MRSKEIEKYKEQLKLTKVQKETLVGILLGDAHLETTNNGKTYRLKVEQKIGHKEYVDHLYEVFQDWVLTPPVRRAVKRGENSSENYRFSTVSHSAFRFYAAQFYTREKKSIPKLLHRWLSDRSLTYWFMDDGSIKSKQSKGVIFNTQGFSFKEVEQLCSLLVDSFELQASLRSQKEGQQIYISGHSYERFCEIVTPYLLPSMKYKLPSPRKIRLT